jgi:hypothetical protein
MHYSRIAPLTKKSTDCCTHGVSGNQYFLVLECHRTSVVFGSQPCMSVILIVLLSSSQPFHCSQSIPLERVERSKLFKLVSKQGSTRGWTYATHPCFGPTLMKLLLRSGSGSTQHSWTNLILKCKARAFHPIITSFSVEIQIAHAWTWQCVTPAKLTKL